MRFSGEYGGKVHDIAVFGYDGGMKQIKMKIPSSKRPVVEFAGELDFADDPRIEQAFLDAELTQYENETSEPPRRLKLTGEVRFTVIEECAKCLAPASRECDNSFETMIDLEEMTSTALDLEIPSEEGGVHRSDDQLDLTHEITQRIYLEAPSLIYCKPDCLGLCPRCGENLNEAECGCNRLVGGKFDALSGLLEELESKK